MTTGKEGEFAVFAVVGVARRRIETAMAPIVSAIGMTVRRRRLGNVAFFFINPHL